MSTVADKPQKNETEILYRDCRMDAPADDDRKIEVSFSSEAPYRREPFFGEPWIEVLGHKSSEVDLTRLNTSASVHYNHSRMRADRIGVVLDARIVNGKGRAIIQLSNREDIEDIWVDVKDKVLQNVSVGYKIHERVLVKSNEDGPDEYRVTNWEPVEISLVDIPADHTVGVDRSASLHCHLTREPNSQVPALPLQGDTKMTDISAASVEEGRRLAQDRVVEINGLYQGYLDKPEFRSLHKLCLDDPDCAIDQARKLLLDEIGKNKTPSGIGQFQPGYNDDGLRISSYRGPANFSDVVVDALLLRSNVQLDKPSPHVDDVRNMSLVDIARASLDQGGVSTTGYSSNKIVSRALTTSDFPNVLANVAEKLVLDGFRNPERGTHRIWTGEAMHRDFKEVSSVAVSETPDLELVGEGGEYRFGKLLDTGDKVALATYGKILPFSRHAIINDDLGELENAARSFGDSAVRLEANLCYVILTGNPLMYDGNNLFDAAHNNEGTAAAPTVESLGEARKLMRNQVGRNDSSFLDPQPYALIVPTSLETAAEQLLSSIYDPAGSIQAANTPDFIRRLQLVADPRLDAASTTRWYLTSNPRSFSWVKRIYLDGQKEPFIDEQTVFDRDDFQIKCRHDFAAKAYMWQGAVRNAGA